MKDENTMFLLKDYITKNIGEDCGDWEYIHIPHIESVIGNLNEKESEEFSQIIWDWDISLTYHLAHPIIFGGNKYLKQDYLYCIIFSQIKDIDDLDYLAENLSACFYSLKPDEYNNELLKKIKFNLLIVLEKTLDKRWKEKHIELLKSIDKKIR